MLEAERFCHRMHPLPLASTHHVIQHEAIASGARTEALQPLLQIVTWLSRPVTAFALFLTLGKGSWIWINQQTSRRTRHRGLGEPCHVLPEQADTSLLSQILALTRPLPALIPAR